MVQIDEQEDRCSVLISVERHTLNDIEKVYSQCRYSNCNADIDSSTVCHESLESALLLYSDTAHYLHLEGIGMPTCTVDTLSIFSTMYEVYMSTVTVPRNRSTEFFSSSTVRHLDLFVVHGIAEMGDMPELRTINITSCIMRTVPKFSRSKYPHLRLVTITASAVMDESASSIGKYIAMAKNEGIEVQMNGTFTW